eukprot:1922944-Prymnesium_polylepis.2
MHQLATIPAILDSVEACIGPDIFIWSMSIFAKPPRSEEEIGCGIRTLRTGHLWRPRTHPRMLSSPRGWH